ncbi:MAG: hypothetical protein K2O86_01080 [Clostridia bacterium]|nr:hypothetical protein [Clostridia bacterium]
MRSYEIISILPSKRKKVYKVESQGEVCILKEYESAEDAEKEMQIANKVALTGYAPKVIDHQDNLVLYEHIEGENFCEAFRFATMTDDVESMELLATRLSIFLQIIYSFTEKAVREVDFNNYVVKDGRVVGVDFLKVDEGMPYEDVASAIAFALMNSAGQYYDSYHFVYKLLDCFKLDMVDVINEVKARLKRRASQVGAKDDIDIDMLLEGLVNFDKKGVDWRKLV